MDLKLTDDVVIVTGGASGIGAAVAQTFVEEGAQVVVWDRQPGKSTRQRIQFDTVDITEEQQVQAATSAVLANLGRIDHLVHAAAIGSGHYGFPFDNLSAGDWRRVLEVNIMGTTNVAHAVAPVMRTQGNGSITCIASVAGQIGSQTDPPYSASKAANINFAQCLAKDLAAANVRVNTICPGMIQTPLNRSVWEAWFQQQPEHAQQNYEDWATEKIRRVVPLQRWQTPEDVANMAVFLASYRAANVTGQTINVDGGFVMHW